MMASVSNRWLVASVLAGLTGCTDLQSGLPPLSPSLGTYQQSPIISYVDLQALPQTIGLEYQDRINRFNRLSAMYGIKPPQIDQLQLSPGAIPGTNYPVPVVRIIFDAAVFFDFNEDTVRPEAEKILDVIAENMRRDVPDARLLVLGHTDAIGTDGYNIDLSKRRATFVMQELVNRGVRSPQLATVAIGKSQPRAPNDTEEGRALNRRVEFMISADQDANVALVQRRRINEAFLRLNANDPHLATVSAHVKMYTLIRIPTSVARSDDVTLRPPSSGGTTVKMITGKEPTLQPVREIDLQKPVIADFRLNQPTEYQQTKLNDEFKLY